MAKNWNSVTYLQNEVVIGSTVNSFSLLVSYLGITMICGLILNLYEKWKNNRNKIH